MSDRVDALFKQFNNKAKYQFARRGLGWEPRLRLPFSSPRLNYMTYGGIPFGSIVEFSGKESSGKTTTALDLVKSAQQLYPERDVIWVDIEGTLDLFWANTLGVDVDSIGYINPQQEYAEKIFDIVETLVKDEETDISLIVMDSLAPMISKQAYEKDMEGATIGGISKSLTLFSNKIGPLLRKKNTILVGINQVRDDMNSSYGGTITPGGRAWKHNCSVRMEFRRADFFDANGTVLTVNAENPVGHFVKSILLKTKVCRPDRKVGYYALNYIEGIDKVIDLIDVGVKVGVVRAGGAWYYLPDENGEELKFQGKQKLKTALIENENLLSLLESRINEILTPEDDIRKSTELRSIMESDVPEDVNLDK